MPSFFRQRRFTALLLVGAACLLFVASAPAAFGSGGVFSPELNGSPSASPSGSPVSPSPSSSPSPSPSPTPAAITCQLSPTVVSYGDKVKVTGALVPGVAGVKVSVYAVGAVVATATTDAKGEYAAVFTARRNCTVVARAEGLSSPAQTLVVRPRGSITRGGAYPYQPVTYVLRVQPASYTGTVTARITSSASKPATVTARVRSGKATFRLPLRGVGSYRVTFTSSATTQFAAQRFATNLTVPWKTVKQGSTGPHVRGLLIALKNLGIRVPYVGDKFDNRCADSLMAFQKAYNLRRTYVADADDWAKLRTATRIRPRYASPAVHIEVNKTRQILMIVRNGSVSSLICVSTGATGNTPEGAFSIQRKTPATSTYGGDGTLTWVMAFKGDFALHGWPSVPPYPASHGCVREPVWVAGWVYSQSFVGERVYIYR